MTPQLFPIPGPWPDKLAISLRPRGGDWLDDEVAGWRSYGVDGVVSLLEIEEENDLQLVAEKEICERNGIRFRSFSVPDRGIPASFTKAVELLDELFVGLRSGETVVVHCRQGIGRSSIFAAGVLVMAGETPQTALHRVGTARKLPVPETNEQRAWVEGLPTSLLAIARE